MKDYEAWTPVTSVCEDGKFTVCVYGRTYKFDNSFFPVSIEAFGEELLKDPISLNASFDLISGGFTDFRYVYSEKDDEHVEVLISAKGGNIVVDETLTVEFDGFIKSEMTVSNYWGFYSTPKELGLDKRALTNALLNNLSIDIKLNKNTSTLFHYWPNDKTSIIPSATTMNSGKMNFTAYPFKPYVWAGNDYKGLGFMMESDKGLELNDSDRYLEITEGEDFVNMHFHLLDHKPIAWTKQVKDVWCETLKPLFFTFGFQATPVKALPTDKEDTYKRFHLYDVEQAKIYESKLLDKLEKYGARWLILHEDWTAVQNYGMPEYPDKFKKFVDEAHKKNIKIMVYFGYEYSSLAPHFSQNADSYLIKSVKGNFTGGWQREPAQRAYMVCYNGKYSDVMIERVCHVMDDYGVDGIYTDGTYVPWECANESHGCGYRDSEGNLHTTFPVLAVREHVKKLYKEVHKRGGIIDTHQSSCCLMPTLAFADSYFDGENIQGAVSKDINFLNCEAFRCEYMGLNMGLTNNFITYIDLDKVAAVSLLHNVMPRANREDKLEYVKVLWDIFDEYKLNSAEWHPYFEDNTIELDGFVKASTYVKDNYKVVMATNYDSGKTSANFDFKGSFKEAKDLITGETFTLENGKANLPVKYFAPKIYLVK